jgi:hypothetical protein
MIREKSPNIVALLGAIALLQPMDVVAETAEGQRKLVLIAGKPSHPSGMHEFRAGSLLLEKALKTVPKLQVERHDGGWVADEATFATADAIVIYADGGPKHPALEGNRLETLRGLMAKGVSLGCMHYGVEVPADKGGPDFREWLGGYYENSFSCNPMWEPKFETFLKHPITQGVKPFSIKDEWYMNMRFRPGFGDGTVTGKDGDMSFTPILVAAPPDTTRDGPYVHPAGPYPHIQAEKGAPEAMMWAVERKDAGRGFGFTGGHFHQNWGNDDFRKVVLNALCWLSKVPVPEGGIASAVTVEELSQNLDPKAPKPTKPAKGPKPAETQEKAPSAEK